jgi:hypothetical protein
MNPQNYSYCIKINVHYALRGISGISKFLGPNTQFILKMVSSVNEGLMRLSGQEIQIQQ